jgi:hypothetical protein
MVHEANYLFIDGPLEFAIINCNGFLLTMKYSREKKILFFLISINMIYDIKKSTYIYTNTHLNSSNVILIM